ncbi:hypothetical protein GCM10009804_29990 [Kribbella hippodromi]|uniref:Uncharacterized protein n=1 Tax=Kribbella hippodromi TaxID=434347 RepID=A0ABN2D6X1_9ACTN
MPTGESTNLTALLAPAQVGVARDGATVFHTGLWLSPNKTLLFIGVVADGAVPPWPQRPSILITGGEDLRIEGLSFVIGSAVSGGCTWLLQTEIKPNQVPLLSGGMLTLRYGDADLEYTAALTTHPQ